MNKHSPIEIIADFRTVSPHKKPDQSKSGPFSSLDNGRRSPLESMSASTKFPKIAMLPSAANQEDRKCRSYV